MSVRMDSRAGSRLGSGMASRRLFTGHQGMTLWTCGWDGSYPIFRKWNAAGEIEWEYTETVYGIRPLAIAVDDDGHVYMTGTADGSSYAVMSVSSAGAFRWANTLFAGHAGRTADGSCIAYSNGHVYVGHDQEAINATVTIHNGDGAGPEDQPCVVTRFTASTGVFDRHIITAGSAGGRDAEFIAVDRTADTLAIASGATAAQVYLISHDLPTMTTNWTANAPADGANVLAPRGLDINGDTGDIYVTAASSGGNADTLSHRVSRYDSSGTELDYLLDSGLYIGSGERIGGIAVDQQGRVIWAASTATHPLTLRIYDSELNLIGAEPHHTADNAADVITGGLCVDHLGRVGIGNRSGMAFVYSQAKTYKRAYNGEGDGLTPVAVSAGPRLEH